MRYAGYMKRFFACLLVSLSIWTVLPVLALADAAANPPVNGACQFVLVTIPYKGTSCNDIGFYTYLAAIYNQILPYVMIIALIMITFSGFQYMMGGVAGDVAAAKVRIAGVLGGIIFFFLIRLILNQLAPNLFLQNTTSMAHANQLLATATIKQIC